MALWRDVVAHWDDEDRELVLRELLGDRVDKPVTQEELDAFYNNVVSATQSDLAQQVYNDAYNVYLSERSKMVCKVEKLV